MKKLGIITVLAVLFSMLGSSYVTDKKALNDSRSEKQDPTPSEIQTQPQSHTVTAGNGIYYWKTVFRLTESNRQFLKEHDIHRIYLRLFDVGKGYDFDGETSTVPIATTRFESEIPEDVEIVPVVYLEQSAFYEDCNALDSLLFQRVKAMGKRNGFEHFREIQLDCDWTEYSHDEFFDLCRKMCDRAHRENIQVSSTIRLHQLKDEAPPVDCGVLMMYNTGSLYRTETENSILNDKDVEPYLKQRIRYKLPLSWAFPTFGWGILLKENRFYAILHQTDFSNKRYYEQRSDGRFVVKENHRIGDVYLDRGDVIRLEKPNYSEIMKVKNRLAEQMKKAPERNIIYHLDSLGLSNFSSTEITDILK